MKEREQEMENRSLVKMALDCGADKAEDIAPAQIVSSSVFRAYCEDNVCGFYGKCWSCPPDIGDIDALRAELGLYGQALLYQVIAQVKDYTDTESMNAAGAKLMEVSQKLHACLRAYLKKPFLHLSGSCHLCPECAKVVDEPCRYPDKMLPSLSAYGVDVRGTCEGTSLAYMNGENTVTFFGMVLYDE